MSAARVPGTSRARRLGLGFGFVALACAVVLSGCGDDTTAAESGSPAPAAGAFPVTVKHGQGSVTIPEQPRRVVALGAADIEIAAALGAPIVGAVRNPAGSDGNWPGMAKPLAADILVLDAVQPNVERIAGLKPDLILATTAQATYSQQYETISKIAPVISYTRGPLQDTGDELTTVIGRALGKESEAAELVADAGKRIEQFTTDHPQAKGLQYAFGQFAGGTTYLALVDDSASSRFMARLGLSVPEELKALATADNTRQGLTSVTSERLGALDAADIAFISAYGDGAEAAFTGNPVVAASGLVRRGGLKIIPVDLAGAILAPNPATTGYILDTLAPLLPSAGR